MCQHGDALPLELVILQLWVPVRADGHRCRARKQVYPVVIGACPQQPVGLAEDRAVLAEEAFQQRQLRIPDKGVER
jgi:hypothetical protein